MADMDYTRRFGGVARLYGVSALERFQNAHVCVVGIGGVGSWVVEALARTAVGTITLIDLDNVAESNVNRQIHALSRNIGMPKVDAMEARILGINPESTVHKIEDFVERDDIGRYIRSEYDFVVDCIDAYKTKGALIAHCKSNKIRIITIGGAGGQIDPLLIRLSDLANTQYDPLLAKTRKLLRREYNFTRNLEHRFDIPCVYSDEQQVYPTEEGEVCQAKPDGGGTGLHCGGFGSATAVTCSFGMIAVSHVLKQIAKKPN